MGATFDPVGLYRFNAVMDMFVREKIDVATVHEHVHALQSRFVRELASRRTPLLERALLVPVEDHDRGHFLTYQLSDAHELYERMLEHDIVTDVRGDRLRFGFGLYHDERDIVGGVERIARALE